MGEQVRAYLEANGYGLADILACRVMVQDDSDGQGPYIAKWDLPIPQPTPEQLAEYV